MVSNDSSVTRNEQTQVAEEDAKAVLQKYDRESNIREKIGVWAWVVTFLGVALTIFYHYNSYFGNFQSQKQVTVHLGTALGLIFFLLHRKKAQQLSQTSTTK